jgi:hypothetical protein
MNRQQRITQWLAALWPDRPFSLTPASADASFRRYFRAAWADGSTAIVMDAPPELEDCRPWLRVQQLFHAASAHVPAVMAQDLTNGFLLLSDLGNATYLSVLNQDNATALYQDALAALVRIQLASRPGVLPEYDHALLKRELDLFPDWYLAQPHQITLTGAQRAELDTVFERLLAMNLAEPKVFVHRDYHSRNLMHLATGANPGIIDFQDAVYGPLSYDIVSLLKDAYIQWDEETALDYLVRYWDMARQAGLPVAADFGEFHRQYEWMGLQRHLKVLGIFARLHHRDGKEGYLKDLPLVEHYVRQTCARYAGFKPILALLDQAQGQTKEAGYTF